MEMEIRSDSVVLAGYVNVVLRDSKVLSSPRGKFVETVEERTFAKAIERADNIFLLHNHRKDRVLGSIKDGNLELREDNIGLYARCEIRDTEVIQKAKDGLLKGWSFGFSKIKDEWQEGEDGIDRRYLKDIVLHEVSILDITPAYVATSVEMRDEDSTLIEQRNYELKIKNIETTEQVEEQRADQLVKSDLSALFDAENFIKIRR